MRKEKVKYKVIISGDILEFSTFIAPPRPKKLDIGFDIKKTAFKSRSVNRSFVSGSLIRFDSLWRSKARLKRLIRCNKDLTVFLTLTFADNRSDLSDCNLQFNLFIKRVSRLYPNFKYIAVPEFQKRGAVHYHLLTNINIPNLSLDMTKNSKSSVFKWERDFADDIWTFGFVKVKSVYGRIDLYLTKYLTKDIDKRLYGRRKFFYSQNISRPKVLTNFDVYSILKFERDIIKKYYKLIFNNHIVNQFFSFNYYQYEKIKLCYTLTG